MRCRYLLLLMGFLFYSTAFGQWASNIVPGEYIIKTNPDMRNSFNSSGSNFSDILYHTFKDKMPVGRLSKSEMIKEYKNFKDLHHLKLDEDLPPSVVEAELKKNVGEDVIVYVERDIYVHTMEGVNPNSIWDKTLAPLLNATITPTYDDFLSMKESVRSLDTSFSSNLWGLENPNGIDIDILKAWQVSQGSSMVVVAVVDTGVQYTHPDLVNNIWINQGEIPGNNKDDDGNGFIDDVFGWDFANGDALPYDDGGHGTHVAGTIAASGPSVKGVAPKVKIMPLKFLGSNGSGKTSDAIYCIDYAISNGAKVINNSWGGGGYSKSLHDVVTRTKNKGIIFVAAAGNEENNNDLYASYPASYPVDNVISVAALDQYGAMASFSNFGKTTVHVGAPGVKIYSSYPEDTYKYLNGTSMASPHVAGLAALIWSKWPYLTYSEVINVIKKTVKPMSSMKGTTIWQGMINAGNALTVEDPLNIPDPTPNPDPEIGFSPDNIALYMKKETVGSKRLISLYIKEKVEGQLSLIKEVNYSLVGSSIPTIRRYEDEDGFLFQFYTSKSSYSLNFKIVTYVNKEYYKTYSLTTR